MQNVIAATLIAGAALTATAATAENPGQIQEQKIAAALAESKDSLAKRTTNPIAAVFSFGSNTVDTLSKSTKTDQHSGGDRYAPPRGAFGGPDR